MKLKNKIALITGAGQGIGKAIAICFAQEGADVAVNDINLSEAEKTSQEIIKLGRRASSYKADVGEQREVNEMVEKILNKYKKIDILVNNVGISKILPFTETTEEVWDKIIDINLKGTFLCCKAVIPQMVKQKNGKIINMSSQSGKRGNSWYAAYCASKFGIIGLTQSIALEFAPHGININAVCPGVIFTPLWDEQLAQYGKKRGLPPEKVKEYLISKIPLGRDPRLEEIANVVLFLVSDESNYMTGQAINVTGGQEMG
jgi:sorbitol-6-phosphate 2-dehydrogenase